MANQTCIQIFGTRALYTLGYSTKYDNIIFRLVDTPLDWFNACAFYAAMASLFSEIKDLYFVILLHAVLI